MQRSVATVFAVAALFRAPQSAAWAAPPWPAEPSALEAPLTNEQIEKLTKAGLSPDLIVMKIKQAPSESLDVSTDALIALRYQNVCDVVIASIFERVAKRATPATPASASPTAQSPPARESPAAPPMGGPGPFPDFELVRAGGGSVRLSEFQGNVIMMIVWATWNGTSGKELPIIQKMYDLYRDRNLVVICLNVDTDRNLVAPFVKKLNLSLPVYFPSPADSGALTASGIPATIILGPDRTLLDRTVGYYPEWEGRWKQVVERYLSPEVQEN